MKCTENTKRKLTHAIKSGVAKIVNEKTLLSSGNNGKWNEFFVAFRSLIVERGCL